MDETCIANIGPRERRKRMVGGVVGLAIGVGLAVALIAAGLPRWWRLIALVPLWSGMLGVLQARART